MSEISVGRERARGTHSKSGWRIVTVDETQL
jgi:hypothetical protein